MTERKTIQLTIVHTEDLHMRPMQELAKAAARFESNIRIEKSGNIFDVKSVLDLLNFIAISIEPEQQHAFDFKLHTDGVDAIAAAAEIQMMIENDFWLMYSRRLKIEKEFINSDTLFRFVEIAQSFSVPIMIEWNDAVYSTTSPLEMLELASSMAADSPGDDVEFILRCGPDVGADKPATDTKPDKAAANAGYSVDAGALKAADFLEQLIKDKLGLDLTRFVDYRHEELTPDFFGQIIETCRGFSSDITLKYRQKIYDMKSDEIVEELLEFSQTNNKLGISGHLRCQGKDALSAWDAIRAANQRLRE